MRGLSKLIAVYAFFGGMMAFLFDSATSFWVNRLGTGASTRLWAPADRHSYLSGNAGQRQGLQAKAAF